MTRRAPSVLLTGDSLTPELVGRVARQDARVKLSPESLERMAASRQVVERALADNLPAYGVTTGLGSLKRFAIAPEDTPRFNRQVIWEHAHGSGPALDRATVRALMVARANAMARGGAGVRPLVAQAYCDLLNAGITPLVHGQTSVGASDLIPAAEVGEVLIGMGEAEYDGRLMPGAEALREAGLKPLELEAKEGLAIINANLLSFGHGALVLLDARALLDAWDVAGCLSLEGFAGNLSVIHPAVASYRPLPGLNASAEAMRNILRGSYLWKQDSARNLQDPLSFRCLPQLHGAARDALGQCDAILQVELNSSGDNPLVVAEEGVILSNGNFLAQALAMAFDHLRLAIATLARASAERQHKLMWRDFSGLPTGLKAEEGPDSGLDNVAYPLGALAADARYLANAASLDGFAPLSEGVEDVASMTPLSVRRTAEQVEVASRLVAHELVLSAQAVDLRGRPHLGVVTQKAYLAVRALVPEMPVRTPFKPDFDSVAALVMSGRLGTGVRP